MCRVRHTLVSLTISKTETPHKLELWFRDLMMISNRLSTAEVVLLPTWKKLNHFLIKQKRRLPRLQEDSVTRTGRTSNYTVLTTEKNSKIRCFHMVLELCLSMGIVIKTIGTGNISQKKDFIGEELKIILETKDSNQYFSTVSTQPTSFKVN